VTILKRCIAVAMAIAASATGVALTATPARAALPYCNNISFVSSAGNGLARYETYVNSSGSYTEICDMNWLNVNGNAGQRRAIKQIQWDLNNCYGKNLDIDGEYGPLTKQAVMQVQTYLNQNRGSGLVVDGWAGPKTRTAMQHVVQEAEWCEYIAPPASIFPGYEWIDYQGPE
jgi:hypothetical protein